MDEDLVRGGVYWGGRTIVLGGGGMSKFSTGGGGLPPIRKTLFIIHLISI